jgi:anti-anti-sigma factor
MEIREDRHGPVLVIAPIGRIDSTTSGDLDARLLALRSAEAPRLVVDFDGVDYISSAGLRVMLTLAKRTKDGGGRLVLCALDPSVRQVFDLAGFSALFAIVASRDEAVAAAGSA